MKTDLFEIWLNRLNLRKSLMMKKGGFKANLITLVTGTLVSQGIGLVCTPIVTRLYTPADFGAISVFVSLSSILSVIICLRYEVTIMLPKTWEQALNLSVASVMIAGFLSSLVFVFGFLGRGYFTSIFSEWGIGHWFLGLPITVFLLGLARVLRTWHFRKNDFKSVAVSNVLHKLSDNGLQILIGITSISGASGLIVGYIVGTLTSGAYLLSRLLPFNSRSFFTSVNKVALRAGVVEYRSFPMFTSWSSLINAVAFHSPALLLTYFYGVKVSGLYLLSRRVLRLPARFLGRSVSEAFYKRFTDHLKADRPIAGDLTGLIGVLLKGAVVPLGIIACFGRILFAFVFGSEWAEAGIFASIMSAWILMQFLASSIATVFYGLRQNKLLALIQVLLLLSSIIPIVVTYYVAKDAFATVIVLSISNIIAYGLYLLTGVYICRKHDRLLLGAALR